MKEQVAEILYGKLTYQNYLNIPEVRREADSRITQIHNLYMARFKEMVGKLAVIGDEEILKITSHWNPIPSRVEGIAPELIKLRLFQAIREAQLQHSQKQLLEEMEE